jgi:hypothetical protein
MNAVFVNDRVIYHFLANWACQTFLNSSNEIKTYHIVQSDDLIWCVVSLISRRNYLTLIRPMINDFYGISILFCVQLKFPALKFLHPLL